MKDRGEYQQVQKQAFKVKSTLAVSSYFGIYIPHTLKVKHQI
jgi:hypothetical protein